MVSISRSWRRQQQGVKTSGASFISITSQISHDAEQTREYRNLLTPKIISRELKARPNSATEPELHIAYSQYVFQEPLIYVTVGSLW